MSLFVALLRGTVQALLSVVQLCFLVRALLSWFPIREDNPFLTLTAMVTDPFIMPVRALFDRFGWFQNLPIDVSFFVSFLLVNAIGSVLLML
jgi:uncharacterized protein YggT (Ycf19 family)